MSKQQQSSKSPHLASSVSAEEASNDIDVATFVGVQIRDRRRFLGMTIAELASACGISISNLSKIENAQVSPTLQSLGSIASSLGMPIASLFQGYDDEGQLFHIPKGKGMVLERPGKSGGHTYELLANNTGQVTEFQPYLITLEEQSKQRATFTNNGMEFLYMLSGAMQYRYGTRSIDVQQGDTLIFDGRTPHGPERITESPAQMLVLVMKS